MLVKMGTFGRRLRAAVARRYPDLTPAAAKDAFAEAMHVGESQVNKWFADSANPQLNTLLEIATALGVSVEWLCAGVSAAYDASRRELPFEQRLPELWSRVDPDMAPAIRHLILNAAGEPYGDDGSQTPES